MFILILLDQIGMILVQDLSISEVIMNLSILSLKHANCWWSSSFLVQDDEAFFSACIIPLGVFLLELHLGNAILLPFQALRRFVAVDCSILPRTAAKC